MARKLEGERVRVQAMVTPKAAAKLAELADKLKMSESNLAAMFLEEAVVDQEWLVKLVTSRFMAPIRALVPEWGKREKEYDKAHAKEEDTSRGKAAGK
jgi:(p)ppGpp synthase/HD superfamily hydrolase